MSPYVERRLVGRALSPGIAIGKACFLVPSVDPQGEREGDVDVAREIHRLMAALMGVGQHLERRVQTALERAGEEAADIFAAHLMLLNDPDLKDGILSSIRQEVIRAELAVIRNLEPHVQRLAQSNHAHLKERADDVRLVQDSILGHLRDSRVLKRCKDYDVCALGSCPGGKNHVLVAGEFTPNLVFEADGLTVAFVVKDGGPTSHAAIIARALGLPAVAGVLSAGETIPDATMIVVDGNKGEVIVNPAPKTLAQYENERERLMLLPHPPVSGLKVLANIDGLKGVAAARTALAEGIGLYRTELEVMAEGRLLSEGEQTRRYSETVKAMGNSPVVIRLLDIGADKVGDWLKLPQETNPALGLRGARLLLKRPDVLRNQARALVRASQSGPIDVLYPMVQDAEQFLRLRQAFEAETMDLPPGKLRHGIMFEVPSACLAPGLLLDVADFASVGTNDLIQYLFAVDREHPEFDHQVLQKHPVLWATLKGIVDAGKSRGKSVSLCGNLAGEPWAVPRLMALGFSTLSVTPNAIAMVRQAARDN